MRGREPRRAQVVRRACGLLVAGLILAAPAGATDDLEKYQGDKKGAQVTSGRTYENNQTTFTFTLALNEGENQVSHVLLVSCPDVEIVRTSGPDGSGGIKDGGTQPANDPSINHTGIKFDPGFKGVYTIVFAGNFAAADFIVKDGNGHKHFPSGDGVCETVSEPPGSEPPGNEPPGNEPPGNEPPGNEPPGNEPPGNEPPGNEPPGNEPPGNEPPGNEPPGNEPPGNEPPSIEPPATEPPFTEPPATEPPFTEPPFTEPPAGDPSGGPATTEPTGPEPQVLSETVTSEPVEPPTDILSTTGSQPAEATDTLPRTGADVGLLASLGAVLAAVGGAARTARRRR